MLHYCKSAILDCHPWDSNCVPLFCLLWHSTSFCTILILILLLESNLWFQLSVVHSPERISRRSSPLYCAFQFVCLATHMFTLYFRWFVPLRNVIKSDQANIIHYISWLYNLPTFCMIVFFKLSKFIVH